MEHRKLAHRYGYFLAGDDSCFIPGDRFVRVSDKAVILSFTERTCLRDVERLIGAVYDDVAARHLFIPLVC